MKKILIGTVAVAAALLLVLLSACTKKTPEMPAAPDSLTHYDMTLAIDESLEKVSLSQTVSVVNDSAEAWDALTFNLYANAYKKEAVNKAYYVDLAGYGGIEITSVKAAAAAVTPIYLASGNVMRLPLTAPLSAGETAVIQIESVITVPKCNMRLGLTEGVLNLGNFYPVLAVYEDGVWREDAYSRVGDPFYAKAADYKVTVQRPASLVVAASGNLTQNSAAQNAENTNLVFEGAGMRDFAVFASYDFHVLNTESDGVAIQYYYRGDAPESALATAASALSTFSALLGKYPYSTYTVVEAPFYYGGMEYSALSLINPKTTDKDGVIVHETAHQWIACLVGSDAVNTPWLDEGLVTFLTDYYLHKTGDTAAFDDIRAQTRKAYDAYSLLQSTLQPDYKGDIGASIYQYKGSYDYSMVAYSKASILFDMIYDYAGEKHFDAALKTYVAKNAYGIATPHDLVAAFQENRKDITPILSGFLSQSTITSVFRLAESEFLNEA